MTGKAGNFWAASQAFRGAKDEEARHQARVQLLGIALSDPGKVGQRAADTLRTEGLIVVRSTMPVHQAI